MNAVSPALSATLSLMPQQNQMTPKAELKMEDKPSSQSTSSGNSTVTLSEDAQAKYSSGLKTEQTVQQAISPESRGIEANQISSGLTYGANLQNTAGVFSSKDESTET